MSGRANVYWASIRGLLFGQVTVQWGYYPVGLLPIGLLPVEMSPWGIVHQASIRIPIKLEVCSLLCQASSLRASMIYLH